MTDLKIEFDSPNNVYFPGQEVTGRVILKSKDPIKASFLKICIHGEAHTGWYQTDLIPYINSENEKQYDHRQVKYSGRVVYLKEETIAWMSTEGNNRIPPGTNIYQFSFELPAECTPSLEGSHGHIRYSVHVELDRPWKFNKKTKKLFSVVPSYDLNVIPDAVNPMVNTNSVKTGLIFKKGQISVTANLPKRGYVPGEIVPITLHIDNGSGNRVSKIYSHLLQLSHFHASFRPLDPDSPTRHSHRDDEKCVAEARTTVNIPQKSEGKVVLSLKVPSVVPSFHCSIIDVEYLPFPLAAGYPPPSFEESMNIGKPEDSEPFAPRYPVYNDLPPYSPSKSNEEGEKEKGVAVKM
ncbi:unnamed protein product [Caenorhabditis brenneri]